MKIKASQKLNLVQKAVIKAIDAYQALRAGRPSPCRYLPSCSEYSKEAVEVHGFMKGTRLSFFRILRCNPLGSSGLDPVPPYKERQS